MGGRDRARHGEDAPAVVPGFEASVPLTVDTVAGAVEYAAGAC